MRKLKILYTVLLVLVLMTVPAGPASAGECPIDVGIHGEMKTGYGNTCHRHHVVSRFALEETAQLATPGYPNGHQITEPTGVAVRMPREIHQRMPTTGGGGEAARLQEIQWIRDLGLPGAIIEAVKRDIAVLDQLLAEGVITQEQYELLLAAYGQAAEVQRAKMPASSASLSPPAEHPDSNYDPMSVEFVPATMTAGLPRLRYESYLAHWSWGDGSSSTVTVPPRCDSSGCGNSHVFTATQSHYYNHTGDYTVTVTLGLGHDWWSVSRLVAVC